MLVAPAGKGATPRAAAEQAEPNNVPLTDAERDRIFANIGAEIRTLDATHHVITRRGAAAVLGSFEALRRTMQLVPKTVAGSLVGYRMRFLQPGSLLPLLGFEVGDVARTINGMDLTVPDMLSQNYGELRNSSRLRCSLLREDKPLVLEVRVE